jgi:pilus assembly protein CpaF
MKSFLERLQVRRGAGRALQAEDIVVRRGEPTPASQRQRKRAETNILLTGRDPSPEGLLAELLGVGSDRGRGSARSALDRTSLDPQGSPPWMNRRTQPSPQLDALVPLARRLLQEQFEPGFAARDLPAAVKRAVAVAARRLAPEFRVSSRDMQDAVAEVSGLISGCGPLQPLYDDPFVTDILIDSFDLIRCVRLGQALETPLRFRSTDEYVDFYSTLLRSAGERVSAERPLVDCVVADEWRSRINVVHGSLRQNGQTALAVRVPRLRMPTLYDLLRSQTVPAALAGWLSEVVSLGETTVLVLGPTGSGKTTLTSGLLSCVGSDERVCTIERVPELCAANCIVEKLLVAGVDGSAGAAVQREQLMASAFRRAPHRIVFGDLQRGDTRHFIDAIETGHTGSLATVHADGVQVGLLRLYEDLRSSSALRDEAELVRARIARSVQLLISMQLVDGRPCVVEVAEVLGASAYEFKVQTLVQYEGTLRGKRRWCIVSPQSPLLARLAERGVQLAAGPGLVVAETFAASPDVRTQI